MDTFNGQRCTIGSDMYDENKIDVTQVSLLIATFPYNDILEPKIRFMDIWWFWSMEFGHATSIRMSKRQFSFSRWIFRYVNGIYVYGRFRTLQKYKNGCMDAIYIYTYNWSNNGVEKSESPLILMASWKPHKR